VAHERPTASEIIAAPPAARPGDAAREDEVLTEAAEALGDWISRLPASSGWRQAFEVIRHEVASCGEQPEELQLVPR
jgi:hypothetical protein